MPQENMDYNAALAKTVGVNENALRALNVSDETLSAQFESVRHGWKWNNLGAMPTNIAGYVAGISAFSAATLSGTLGGFALAFGLWWAADVMRDQDKRSNVAAGINDDIAVNLISLNPEATAESSAEAGTLGKILKMPRDAVKAAEIEPEKLTDIYNRASSADKWADYSAKALLGSGAIFLGGVVLAGSAAAITSLAATAFLASAASTIYNHYRLNKVKNEVQEAIDDKFVALTGGATGDAVPAPQPG